MLFIRKPDDPSPQQNEDRIDLVGLDTHGNGIKYQAFAYQSNTWEIYKVVLK